MNKSEWPTREWTLASSPTGEIVLVVNVRAERAEELFVHGIRPGARLTVDGDAPFGGPRIVRLGGSRLAIDRRLAGTVDVVRANPGVGPR